MIAEKQPIRFPALSKKGLLSFFLLCLCAVSLANCGQNPASRLIIGGPQNVAMLVIVAQQKGFFDAQHVSVEYRPLQNGKITFDALVAREIDLGILLDANIAFLGFAGQSDVVVLGKVTEKSDDGIIARRDHGIVKAADLAGKRIGYLPASTSHVFLHRFSEQNHLDLTKSVLVPMSPPAMQAAIVHGDVDAASVWQPYRLNAAATLGADTVQFDNKGLYWSAVLLSTRREIMAGRGPEITRIFAALTEASKFAHTHKDESITLLSKAIGVDRPALEASWNEYRFDVGDVDASLVASLTDIGTWISHSQPELRGKPVPDYQNFIAPNLAPGAH